MQHACDLRGTGQGNTLKGGGGISMFCFVYCVIKEKGFSLYPSEFLGENPLIKDRLIGEKQTEVYSHVYLMYLYTWEIPREKRASL